VVLDLSLRRRWQTSSGTGTSLIIGARSEELVWQAAGYDGVEATVEYLPQDHGFLPRLFSRQEREESQPLVTSGVAL
jgi:hypothetical protein